MTFGRDERVEDERGAVLVLLSFFLFIFLAVAALAVDLSALSAQGQTVQNSADAAALAAVAEYKQQLLATGSDAAARAAADAVVEQMLIQNGLVDPNNPGSLKPGVTWTVDYLPDDDAVIVTITDGDVEVYVGDVVNIKPSVTRRARAEFFACQQECAYEIRIPRPFPSVRAKGFGDGYKPIPVGTRMYALNHNSTGRHIVCVDRATAAPCWPVTERVAYSPSVGFNARHPEMPHAAVVGTTIYWSASDANGHRLFCWETATDSPCSTAVTLSTRPRANRDVFALITDRKDEDRGGGTVAVGDKVYAFTDDHKVHCYDPASGSACYAPVNTSLGNLGFPANEPVDGNHGGSIDRIVDENTGYIYSTLHINYAVECAALADPDGEPVVLRNVATGQFLTASESGDEIVGADDGRPEAAQWDARNRGAGTFSFESRTTGGYLDADEPPALPIGWSVDFGDGDRWRLSDVDPDDGSVLIRNYDTDGYMVHLGAGLDIISQTAEPGLDGRWEILPVKCGDPVYAALPDQYAAGTWLHCFDTGTVSGFARACPDFAPTRLHANADRFSGRLFFYHDSDATPTVRADDIPKRGVCSSGYNATYASPTTMDRNDIEISCVNMSGADSPALEANLVWLRDRIRQYTDPDAPAAWGDPHWNHWDNRLLYPTEHGTSRIICFDFDSGPCGTVTGVTPSGTERTEDYGFFSERNCVYALGHTANFWAFASDDLGEPCAPQPQRVPIEPCDCDTKLRWGRLDFSEIDLSRVSLFQIRIVRADSDDPPIVVWPADGSQYTIDATNQNTLIDLDSLATDGPDLELEVYAEYEGDPYTVPDQTFAFRITQLPHLTE